MYKTHGMSGTRIYSLWKGMKNRCYYKKNPKYHNYGGRGIIVCDEWKNDFMRFYEWSVKNGYSDDLTIDRINNDGNYEPDNCRWITKREQNYNKRTNRYLRSNGVTKTATEWAHSLGSERGDDITKRIENGWSVDDAVSTPIKHKPKEVLIDIDGELKNISQWSEIYKIHRTTINSRLKVGWNGVDAVTTPPGQKPRKG